MARTLPKLGVELVQQIEAAWAEKQADWQRKRLLVARLIAQHEYEAEEIAKIAGVSRRSVFRYRDLVVAQGVEGLLRRENGGGPKPTLRGDDRLEFEQKLAKGEFRQIKDAREWIAQKTTKTLSVSGTWTVLRRLGGKLKVPRKVHVKKDPAKAEAFKANLPTALSEVVAADARPVRVWVLDEHRYGLLPVLRRVWAKKGVRVHAPYATRYLWGYLHEAMEVDGAHRSELLFTPSIDQQTHLIFLRQIAQADETSLHVVIADQAGFHLKPGDDRLPSNLRLLPLPPYSPELNPTERLGGLIKARICNRLFIKLKELEEAIENTLKDWLQPEKVKSLIHEWLAISVNGGALT